MHHFQVFSEIYKIISLFCTALHSISEFSKKSEASAKPRKRRPRSRGALTEIKVIAKLRRSETFQIFAENCKFCETSKMLLGPSDTTHSSGSIPPKNLIQVLRGGISRAPRSEVVAEDAASPSRFRHTRGSHDASAQRSAEVSWDPI